jgi:hypothetical protein
MSNQIIKRTKNGLLFYCNSCNLIHLEFKNLNFNFSKKQMKKFTEYIQNLNAKEWEEINKASPFKRKIVVPISHDSFNFLLNSEELAELQELVSPNTPISLNTLLLQDISHINRCN